MTNKNKNLYELTFWLNDSLSTQPGDTTQAISQKIFSLKGEVIRTSPLRRRRSAYALDKKSLNLFGYIYFELDKDKINDLKEFLNHQNNALRFSLIGRRTFETKEQLLIPTKAREVQKPSISQLAERENVNPEELEKKLAEILGEEK